MNNYSPSFAEMETLLDTNPQYFDHPLLYRRLISGSAARPEGPWPNEIQTKDQMYEEYLANGGPAVEPNGELPPAEVTSDQVHGEPGCDCEAATPCCIKGITFSCSHGTARMKLPLEDGNKECRLVLVTDKDPRPGNDKLKIELDRVSTPGCSMPASMPLLSLSGGGNDVSKRGEVLEHEVSHSNDEGLGSTDLSRFAAVTGKTLFGSLDDLGQDVSFEVQSCAGIGAYGAIIQTFPKVEWEATAFSFELSGQLYSNLSFVPQVKLEGKLEGTYGPSTFSIEGSGEFKPDPQNKTKSIMPFLNKAMEGLQASTGNSGVKPEARALSSMKLSHKFLLGPAKFSLAEFPDDHTKIGIEADISMGFDPLFGLDVKLDIIDLVARIAGAAGGAPQIADAIAKAREVMAKGYGNADSLVQASAKVDISLAFTGSIGAPNMLNFKRAAGSDVWEGSGGIEGEIGIEFKAELAAEGRYWLIKGAASASGTAASKLKGGIKTLTASESAAAKGAKVNIKLDWDGVTMVYQAQASLSIFGARATTGTLRLVEEAEIHNENY